MKAYSGADEETLRARNLLKDWAGEGFLTEAQYQLMERETVCDLRRTNVFLRAVLFLFTLIIVGAGLALFFTVFLSRPSEQTTGFFLLIFAAASYVAAELAVSQARLYRYGIEESLAVCSVGFLCGGIGSFQTSEYVVAAAGALASLWIWHRFGLVYAFLAAMIFVVWLPGYWTSSHAAQHLIVAGFYAAGLVAVTLTRPRQRSIAEALLWLGIYLAINLRIFSIGPDAHWWGGVKNTTEFSRPFYWSTWVLIWCLPPVVLARGLRKKDRFVMAAGGIAAVVTLITNKPYLEWPRHTWDPMLLGALLIGIALWVRRWLASGPDGIRRGFTAQRLSGKDKQWLSAGSAALGIASPHAVALNPQSSPEVRFGGGDSAGGGATSDY